MTPPPTILLSQIDLGVRGRTEYRDIEQLAESIEQNGLIQPIVLVPNEIKDEDGTLLDVRYNLIAGGRRINALLALGTDYLYHATTSTVGRPGYLLKGEAGTELSNLLTEIAENRDRADMTWQDEVKMLVRATRMIQENTPEHTIVLRDFGVMLGVNYQDIRIAVKIHDDLIASPESYRQCDSMRKALSILLDKEARYVQSLLVKKPSPTGLVQVVPGQEAAPAVRPQVTIDLSRSLILGDGIATLRTASVDHVICDPDFAVSKERLEAGVVGAAAGVAQLSIDHSLDELHDFIEAAAVAIRPNGFLVFFYDLDHHEKLQQWCAAAGFQVQRWPLIWHKTDYRSNASPQSNFTKNIEYAMVCRKPGATLAKSPQMSSIFAAASGPTTKSFGHPFAKPEALWRWIYDAVTVPGQTVFDPFAGSGSATVAALAHGLNPIACEIQEQHYNSLVLNVQAWHRAQHPDAAVIFT